MGGDKVLPILTGLSDEDDKGKRIAERREKIFAEKYLPAGPAPARARASCSSACGSEGLRLAVASSSKKEMLEAPAALVGAEDLLEAKTSSDDAENSKPDPDIVQAALRRLGQKPDERR